MQDNRKAVRQGWSKIGIVGGLALLCVLVFVGYRFGFSDEQSSRTETAKARKRGDDEAPTVVAIATATQADFSVYLQGLGTVTALRTVTVNARVDGELVRVTFEEGQMVNAGDLLAEIDPRPFRIQLQQAEGQLLRDQALLKNAEQDLVRYQTLSAQDSIADQQTATQAALVKQYQGTVAMDKAQVENAKLQLSYARLTAPIGGRVGLRRIDQGNIVHAGDSNGLAVITQLQPISVVFTLPEDKVPALVQRQRAKQAITVEAYDRAGKIRLAAGKLLAIDNQIDATTGTLKLKAQFDNHDNALFANQFVNVKMHLDTLHNVTQVANAAIQQDTQGAFVYVVDADDVVWQRRVEIGPTEAEKTVVLAHLAAGERVVIEGLDRLREGCKVDVARLDGQAVAEKPLDPAKAEGKSDHAQRRI